LLVVVWGGLGPDLDLLRIGGAAGHSGRVTDWEKINREDQQRHDQVALGLGLAFTGIAVFGVLGALLGFFEWHRALGSNVVNLLIGIPLLFIGLRARRRDRQVEGRSCTGDKTIRGERSPARAPFVRDIRCRRDASHARRIRALAGSA
jgi:hypothetical protein